MRLPPARQSFSDLAISLLVRLDRAQAIPS